MSNRRDFFTPLYGRSRHISLVRIPRRELNPDLLPLRLTDGELMTIDRAESAWVYAQEPQGWSFDNGSRTDIALPFMELLRGTREGTQTMIRERVADAIDEWSDQEGASMRSTTERWRRAVARGAASLDRYTLNLDHSACGILSGQSRTMRNRVRSVRRYFEG